MATIVKLSSGCCRVKVRSRQQYASRTFSQRVAAAEKPWAIARGLRCHGASVGTVFRRAYQDLKIKGVHFHDLYRN